MVQNILTRWGFSGLRLLAGFNSRAAAAAYFGISERTLRRREQENDAATARILAAKAGFLGAIDPDWIGFELRAGRLRYDHEEWTPGDLHATFYQRALIAELTKQVRHFQAKKKAGIATGQRLADVLQLDDYRR